MKHDLSLSSSAAEGDVLLDPDHIWSRSSKQHCPASANCITKDFRTKSILNKKIHEKVKKI